MKISFLEAATQLETICNEIDNAEEITEAIQRIFQDAADELGQSVDRRISFIDYCETQIEASKRMRDNWVARARKFELLLERIKKQTVETIKANPDLPYKGILGYLKIQRNSMPSVIIEDEAFLLEIDDYRVQTVSLDKTAIRKDLMKGVPLKSARLEYGEHLKIGVGK